MAAVVMKLDGRFQKRLRTVFKGYTAEVGVLVDKPHKAPVGVNEAKKKAQHASANQLIGSATTKNFQRFKEYAGGPARKTSSKTNGTMSSVSESLRKGTGINFYTAPFRNKNNREILKFAQGFVNMFLRGGVSKKRVENLLQAIVRNPILRGDYGGNSAGTIKAKGFSRFMIDTSQLFQNIKAKVSGRGKNV